MSKGNPVKAMPSPNAVPTRQVIKVGRNDECPCGSGKKYKSCHLSQGEEWLHQMAYKQERERQRAAHREGRDGGVSWWRRLLGR